MFISITIESNGIRRDVRIDNEQKIKECVNVLRQSRKLPMGNEPDYFRSRINQTSVSAHKTFVEECVFDGDVLTLL